jgi:hypothetical protein
MKTGWISVFHHREAHNHPRLDITMMYTFFEGFEKYHVFLKT